MTLRKLPTIAATLCVAFQFGLTRPAHAWEGQTTHAGLTEQGALQSRLHQYLRDHFGLSLGAFERLQVPEADAPSLFNILRRMSPTHGYVPDSKGRMSALSWLVAGSAVADIPVANASHHFFDPLTKRGLTTRNEPGLGDRIGLGLLRAGGGATLGPSKITADEFWRSPDNPMGLNGFREQFVLAVSSELPQQRSRHLAGALLAAGSMLHVLQDMGSPSHVRDDLAAHQQQIGHDKSDRGSRFERIAALAFSRLGVPRASEVTGLTSLAAHFHNSEGTGLADVTERSYFSANTLPKDTPLRRDEGLSVFQEHLKHTLQRPSPTAARGIDNIAARNLEGATYRSKTGICLARYRYKLAKIHFWTDDDCALEQLEEILPQVAGYSASFLESLFRSDVELVMGEQGISIVASYAAGNWRIFFDDAQGKRREVTGLQTEARSAALPAVVVPADAQRVSVLFEGMDANGNQIVATASRLLNQ